MTDPSFRVKMAVWTASSSSISSVYLKEVENNKIRSPIFFFKKQEKPFNNEFYYQL